MRIKCSQPTSPREDAGDTVDETLLICDKHGQHVLLLAGGERLRVMDVHVIFLGAMVRLILHLLPRHRLHYT